MEYSITDFGAKGDGVADNTVPIQSALDRCRERGGTVIFPAGDFVTGTLYIHSNTTLKFEHNSRLLGVQDARQYKKAPGFCEEPFMDRALLIAEDEENITICGEGTIDGRGDKEHFRPQGHTESGKSDLRPMLLCFCRCKNVKLLDISFKDPAGWGLVFKGCESLYFSRIKVSHRSNVNNDGIDLDGCSDVFIEGCHISSGDDAICLKSACGGVCKNVVISNCVISSDTAGFKIGTSSVSDYSNITLTNCAFENCRMGTIKILMVDGGRIDGVNISDCVIKDSEGPLFIRLGERMNRWGAKDISQGRTTCLRNVMLSNIIAHIRDGCERDRWGVMITGTPDYHVENIFLNNVKIDFPGGGNTVNEKIAEDIDRYPEQFFFGTLPSSAFFIRHAKGIFLNNIFISHREKDARPLLYTEDVSDLFIQYLWHGNKKIY